MIYARKKTMTAFLFSILTLTFLITPALPFSTLGLEWRDSDIPPLFSVNSAGTNDCTGEFGALFRSGRNWNEVPGSYFFFWKASPVLNNLHAGNWDGYNQVSWDPAPINDYIAVTYPYGWNRMVEADISFNSNYEWNCEGSCPWTKMDVENIATHELGHALGLGHSSYSNATMYAYANYGETKKRSLHFDDIDGLEYLYPAAGRNSDAIEGQLSGSDYFLSQPETAENGLIEIAYNVPEYEKRGTRAELMVWDVNGDAVRSLARELARPGMHTILWDGRNDAGELVSPGVYFLTFDSGDFFASRKLLPDLFL